MGVFTPPLFLSRFGAMYNKREVTPFQCRLRDCTYSAPLWVNVRYTRGRQIVNKANINIGRIPVMLLRYLYKNGSHIAKYSCRRPPHSSSVSGYVQQ